MYSLEKCVFFYAIIKIPLKLTITKKELCILLFLEINYSVSGVVV